ncbi:hypothetical protein BC834DRAFT_821407 [Gloeopeniophorella convolvens]|nr:hypothetical protein BC834DRAFT_821407 [Gloeopeniophorella convolvens]
MPRWNRTLSLVASFFGASVNLILAINLFTLWRSLKWDTESEWEGSVDPWTVNSVGLVGGLSAAYLVTAAVASTVGFVGIVKGVPSYVRFYRDFSAADFTFCTISTLFVTYASVSYYSVRTSICEELSRHGDLMRDLAEMGLSSENCEQWFERVLVVFVAVMFIIIVIRLHLVIAVSSYYSQLSRFSRDLPLRMPKDGSLQRIYLLPSPTASSPSSPIDAQLESTALVYAPVSLGNLSEREVRGLNAREAWIQPDVSHSPRQHRHSHSRGHRHSVGRIVLPIRPEEGLLNHGRGQEKYKD